MSPYVWNFGYTNAVMSAVYGSEASGELSSERVYATYRGVRPEFLLYIGEFIGNYSRIN